MRPPISARRALFWLPVATIVIAVLAAAVVVGAVDQRDAVELDAETFRWLDVKEDAATFEWSVNVINNTGDRTLRVRVILDLLDDDDRAVNRDDQGNPNDVVIITVEPGGAQPVAVSRQGAIGYDRAAEVVQYRHRWELVQGDS